MPLHVSSICAHYQEVKIALHSLWYHHIYQHMQILDVLLQLGYIWRHVSAVKQPKHVARYNPFVIIHLVFAYVDRCDDTRGCVMQFWLPDDKHMCSKHVELWNKLIVKQKFCASSRLITEVNWCKILCCLWLILCFLVSFSCHFKKGLFNRRMRQNR